MDYRVKNVLGVSLEAAAIAGIAFAVKYDSHFLIYLAAGIAYSAGSDLRNQALQEKIESKYEEKIESRHKQGLTDRL